MDAEEYKNQLKVNDELMSDISTKDVLRHIIAIIYYDLISAISMYYEEAFANNLDGIYFIKRAFEYAKDEMYSLLPVLRILIKDKQSEDEYYLIDEILTMVCGEDSDEIYTYKKFIELDDNKNFWEEKDMWRGFDDERLQEIHNKMLEDENDK